MIRTTLHDLAPWVVLIIVVAAAVASKLVQADPAVFQLLSTVAGICGGALLPRKSDPQTTTLTAGNPPTVTTGPTQ